MGRRSEELRRSYGALNDSLLEILDRHDPIGIAFVAPDEYEPEVSTS